MTTPKRRTAPVSLTFVYTIVYEGIRGEFLL